MRIASIALIVIHLQVAYYKSLHYCTLMWYANSLSILLLLLLSLYTLLYCAAIVFIEGLGISISFHHHYRALYGPEP